MPYFPGVEEDEEAHKLYHKEKVSPAPIAFAVRGIL